MIGKGIKKIYVFYFFFTFFRFLLRHCFFRIILPSCRVFTAVLSEKKE